MINIKNGPLYQWDLNRAIEIYDPENKVFEVECCRDNDANAVILPFSRNGEKIEVVLPNSFLQSAQDIHIFTVYKENDEVRTSKHKIYSVISRAKPTDYVYQESEILDYKHLEEEFRKALVSKADLDENGKIDPKQLPESSVSDETLNKAVKEAIAQAKESGDLKGEKGDKGDKGDTGAQGAQGPKGDKGDTGAQGAQGPKGDKGDTGVQGAQGPKGDKGDTGAQGAQGPKGDKGDTGAQGAQGPKGDKGDTGAQGPKGDNGTDGYTPQKGIDYFTEADKAEIALMVIDSFGGNPVVGYVDANNNIIVQGDLADGSYSVKYEMEDGSTLNIGNLVIDTNVYYSVTNNLTNSTNSNSAKSVVEGNSYSATISANSGYELKSLAVRMGGTDISSSVVSGTKINIAKVTGNIVITAVAEEKVETPTYTNLFVPSGATINKRLSSSYALSDADGKMVTNFINVSNKVPFTANTKIYIKGAIFTNDGNTKIVTYKSSGTSYTGAFTTMNGSGVIANVKDEGNGVISVTGLKDAFESGVIRMCLTLQVSTSKITSADIQNIVITIDEPIA